MRIILTHEQADFDALASLLAGYLLDDPKAEIRLTKLHTRRGQRWRCPLPLKLIFAQPVGPGSLLIDHRPSASDLPKGDFSAAKPRV